MLQAFIKIVFYAFIAFIVYQLIHFFRAINRISKSRRSQNRPSGQMVKDEACNTYLPKEDAIREIIKGKEHYFCSKECRQKFLEGQTSH